MPGGRPRKSLAQHIKDGTYRKDRHGPLPGDGDTAVGVESSGKVGGKAAGATTGQSVVSEPVKMPVQATQSAANQAKLWNELTKLLGETVTDRDAHMLREMCWWWAELLKIQEQLGNMVPGQTRYKETLTAAGVAIDKVTRIGEKFGLTPGDRAKLGVGASSGPPVAKVAVKPKTKLDAMGPPKRE
jgi:phage terminase small subunit